MGLFWAWTLYWLETSGRVDRLLRIELWLSLVGGLSVIFENLWDVFF